MSIQTQAQVTRPNLLRAVLRANGVFSTISGIVMVVGAGVLAPLLGQFAPVVLIVIGVNLPLFAALVFYVAAQETISRTGALVIVVLDALWVLGSIVGLLAGWFPLTVTGKWAVMLVADVVATFATLQLYAVLVRRR